MNDVCESINMEVEIQENGLIRGLASGHLIGKLNDDVTFSNLESMELKRAFKVIEQAMVKDNPSKPGSYAHGWHCNIAMACYDAMNTGLLHYIIPHKKRHEIANEAASRFMKLCFNVETKA